MVPPAESFYDGSMTRFLHAAAILAITLWLASPLPVYADGRADWLGYAWQQIKADTCLPAGTTLQCPPYHEKWDWKRNQWVDISIALDPATGTLRLTQRLTDNDSGDDDYVCVTAIAVDAVGHTLVAHHQNWHMDPGGRVEQSFSYRSPRLGDIAAIHIGSKQCRRGAGQDDALYAHVLAGIGS